jgi:hypothetical protein
MSTPRLFKHQRFRVPEARKANRKVWGDKHLNVYLSKNDTLSYNLPKHSIFEIKKVPAANSKWTLIDFQGMEYWIETQHLSTCIVLDEQPPLQRKESDIRDYDIKTFNQPLDIKNVQRQNFVYHPNFGICIIQDYIKDYLPGPHYMASLVLKSVDTETEHRVWANECYVTL